MAKKGNADARARAKAGVKPLKFNVPIGTTIAFLKRTKALKHPPGSYAGREHTWDEVSDAAAALWLELVRGEIEE